MDEKRGVSCPVNDWLHGEAQHYTALFSKGSPSPIKPETRAYRRLQKQAGPTGMAEEQPCYSGGYLSGSDRGSTQERKHSGILAMDSYSKPCTSSEDSYELQSSPGSDVKSFSRSMKKDEGYQSRRLKHVPKRGEKAFHRLELSSLYPDRAGDSNWMLKQQKAAPSQSSLSSSNLSVISQGSSSSLSVPEEKIEAKLKFSQFLNEVTFRVLDPVSLQAFRASKLKSSLGSGGRSLEDLRLKKKAHESWKTSPPDRKMAQDTDLESSRSDDTAANAQLHKLEKSLSLDAGPLLGRQGNEILRRVKPIRSGETFVSESNEGPARTSASLPRRASTLQKMDAEAEFAKASDASCDVACLLYDVTDCKSFNFCASIYKQHYMDGQIPCLFVATKSDLPQTSPLRGPSPAEFCYKHRLPPPLHFTCNAHGAPSSGVYSKLATAATFPHLNDIDLGAASFWIRVALGATVAAVVGVTLYKAVAKNK